MSFEQTWANADPDATGGGEDNFDPPADGTFNACLTDAAAFNSKDGRPFVKFVWQKLDDEYLWTVMPGFKSQAQANMTKAQVRQLGVPVDQIGAMSELDAALKDHIGEFFTVTVRTNGKFRNTTIDCPANEHATSDVPVEIPVTPEQVPAADDEPVPF